MRHGIRSGSPAEASGAQIGDVIVGGQDFGWEKTHGHQRRRTGYAVGYIVLLAPCENPFLDGARL